MTQTKSKLPPRKPGIKTAHRIFESKGQKNWYRVRDYGWAFSRMLAQRLTDRLNVSPEAVDDWLDVIGTEYLRLLSEGYATALPFCPVIYPRRMRRKPGFKSGDGKPIESVMATGWHVRAPHALHDYVRANPPVDRGRIRDQWYDLFELLTRQRAPRRKAERRVRDSLPFINTNEELIDRFQKRNKMSLNKSTRRLLAEDEQVMEVTRKDGSQGLKKVRDRDEAIAETSEAADEQPIDKKKAKKAS